MAIILKCEGCGNTHRYHSSEMENAGTEWHPTWTVKCKHCGSPITSEQGTTDLFDRPTPPKEIDAYERAKTSDIREYWIQEYLKENYAKLGFSKLEGPSEIGPDFRGVFKGKRVIVEAERDYRSFLAHRHHEDERYKEVSVLVVLNPSEAPSTLRERLPETILHIDVNDFVEWWRPKAKAYAKTKRIQNIINMIAGEFQRRYVNECQDKDRDMSTCPDCDLCAYFGEGIFWEAQPLFRKMALTFIAVYKHPITSDDFKLRDIDPSEIDEFYLSYDAGVF